MMHQQGWWRRLTKLVILMTVLAVMPGYSSGGVVVVRLNDGRLFLVSGRLGGRFSADDGETWTAVSRLVDGNRWSG